ncbi:MAG: hypothetical protein JWQ42_2653 [Edaphobacter sp.]|nr:hypothetical protein [Edaphobacter sp.]
MRIYLIARANVKHFRTSGELGAIRRVPPIGATNSIFGLLAPASPFRQEMNTLYQDETTRTSTSHRADLALYQVSRDVFAISSLLRFGASNRGSYI